MKEVPLVIKVGGNDLARPGFIDELTESVAELNQKHPCVIVHGGGRTVDKLLDQLGIEPKYVNGQRVTDDVVLEIVEMVLSGQVNKRLTHALTAAGVDALGMSGVDRGLLWVEPWSADMGWVGRVVRVRREVLLECCQQQVVPVISPISAGPDGRYNVNADHAAGAIAAALHTPYTVFITNVPGVYVGESVAAELPSSRIDGLIEDGTLHGGMIPKVNAALDVLKSGAQAVTITDLAGLRSGGGTRINGG
ncbi:MAG: acetylglutamate kinase [Anaerolineae bacterium]|nr:acetylglutamate kinase [Anaerolineae bacterium]